MRNRQCQTPLRILYEANPQTLHLRGVILYQADIGEMGRRKTRKGYEDRAQAACNDSCNMSIADTYIYVCVWACVGAKVMILVFGFIYCQMHMRLTPIHMTWS